VVWTREREKEREREREREREGERESEREREEKVTHTYNLTRKIDVAPPRNALKEGLKKQKRIHSTQAHTKGKRLLFNY